MVRRSLGRVAVGIAYGIAAVGALAGVVATLLIPQRIDSPDGVAHFGEPLAFVDADMSRYSPPPSFRDHRFAWDPWEDPAIVNPARFIVDYALFAIPLCGLVWLSSRVRRRVLVR